MYPASTTSYTQPMFFSFRFVSEQIHVEINSGGTVKYSQVSTEDGLELCEGTVALSWKVTTRNHILQIGQGTCVRVPHFAISIIIFGWLRIEL